MPWGGVSVEQRGEGHGFILDQAMPSSVPGVARSACQKEDFGGRHRPRSEVWMRVGF